MLAAAGWPWTIIPVERRNEYMTALEAASGDRWRGRLAIPLRGIAGAPASAVDGRGTVLFHTSVRQEIDPFADFLGGLVGGRPGSGAGG